MLIYNHLQRMSSPQSGTTGHQRYPLRPLTDDICTWSCPALMPLPARTHNVTPPPQAFTPIPPPQHQHSFLSLPYELRYQIYIDVLGGPNQPVHILRMKDRLTCVRCWMPHEPEAKRHGCLGSLSPKGDFVGWLSDSKDYGAHGPDDRKTGTRGMLELLRTCRLIYAEGLHLLYSTPEFWVDNVDTMLSWKESVLPSRFNHVRSLDLKYGLMFGARGQAEFDAAGDKWRAHWQIVGNMEALRRLRVRLRIMNPPVHTHHTLVPADDEEIMLPLESVTGPEDFVVIVNWIVEGDEIVMERGGIRPKTGRSTCLAPQDTTKICTEHCL